MRCLIADKGISMSNWFSQISVVPPSSERDEDEVGHMETIQLDSCIDGGEMPVVKSRHVPTNVCQKNTRWSPEEIEILSGLVSDEGHTGLEKYKDYQRQCRILNLPDRTLKSFLHKVARAKKQEKS